MGSGDVEPNCDPFQEAGKKMSYPWAETVRWRGRSRMGSQPFKINISKIKLPFSYQTSLSPQEIHFPLLLISVETLWDETLQSPNPSSTPLPSPVILSKYLLNLPCLFPGWFRPLLHTAWVFQRSFQILFLLPTRWLHHSDFLNQKNSSCFSSPPMASWGF